MARGGEGGLSGWLARSFVGFSQLIILLLMAWSAAECEPITEGESPSVLAPSEPWIVSSVGELRRPLATNLPDRWRIASDVWRRIAPSVTEPWTADRAGGGGEKGWVGAVGGGAFGWSEY